MGSIPPMRAITITHQHRLTLAALAAIIGLGLLVAGEDDGWVGVGIAAVLAVDYGMAGRTRRRPREIALSWRNALLFAAVPAVCVGLFGLLLLIDGGDTGSTLLFALGLGILLATVKVFQPPPSIDEDDDPEPQGSQA